MHVLSLLSKQELDFIFVQDNIFLQGELHNKYSDTYLKSSFPEPVTGSKSTNHGILMIEIQVCSNKGLISHQRVNNG
jgi:hypothetical protein